MARWSEASPIRINWSRQDSLMLRTNLSAKAFRLGDLAGSRTDSMPACAWRIRIQPCDNGFARRAPALTSYPRNVKNAGPSKSNPMSIRAAELSLLRLTANYEYGPLSAKLLASVSLRSRKELWPSFIRKRTKQAGLGPDGSFFNSPRRRRPSA